MSERLRPTDPVVLAALRPAARPLVGVVGFGVLGGLVIIAQAWAVTALVIAVVEGTSLTTAGIWVIVALALRAAASWLVDICAARAAGQVASGVRQRVLDAAAAGIPLGRLAGLAGRGASATEPWLTKYLPALVVAAVLPPLVVVAIASQDWVSALIVVLTLPLIPVFGALIGMVTQDKADAQWREMASLSGHFLDVMRGLPTLVAYGRARRQSEVIGSVADRHRRRTMDTLKVAFASSAVLELVATISVALVAVAVGLRLAAGHIELHPALVVLLLAPEAYWPLRRVGAEFHAAAEGMATFAAAAALPEAPRTSDRVPTTLGVTDLSVSFSGRPVIRGVDFEVSGPGVSAIVGPSGCGKSTLLAVLAGAIEPTEGQVLADGEPLAGRWPVAWLPQRPVFVPGTISDNLRLAAPTAGDEQMNTALETVGLGFALDTPVGEDGLLLSAGERARLALARVLISGRSWVFLDEPTAHLDEVTEAAIVRVVRDMAVTRRVILVAHRPALLKLADQTLNLAESAYMYADSAQEVHRVGANGSKPAEGEQVGATARSEDQPDQDEPIRIRGGLRAGALLGGLASTSGVALTATAGWLIVRASEHPVMLTMLVAIVAVRAFGMARPALRYAERLVSHDAALRLLANRRRQVYDDVVALVPAGLGARRGEVLAGIVDDTESVIDRELRVRIPVRGFVVTIVLAALVGGLSTPVAALVVLACGSIGMAAFAVARAGGRRAEPRLVAARAEISARAVDAIETMPELVTWSSTDAAHRAVVGAQAAVSDAMVAGARWLATAKAVVLASTGVLMVVMAMVVGDVSGPVAAALVLLPLALSDVSLGVADAGAAAARSEAAGNRLVAITERQPVVVDPDQPRLLPDGAEINIDHVAVAGRLAELSLDIPTRRRVGIVGPSGCGKSTLADLLLKFVAPDSGQVTLAGVDTSQLSGASVRSRVGLVEDTPHIFASTLVENVRFARPDATDDQVADALRAAALSEWLDALPDGLQTRVGDGGSQVSGGERARIGVARSLLADHPVVVLDEPTAHLDAGTAAALAHEVMGQDRSVVWITHDPVGLDLVDAVVALAAPAVSEFRDQGPTDSGPATVVSAAKTRHSG